MIDDPITLLATPLAILAITNLIKDVTGWKDRYATLLAIAVGIWLHLMIHFFTGNGWFDAAATGLIFALSASGLFDTAKIASTRTLIQVDTPPDTM